MFHSFWYRLGRFFVSLISRSILEVRVRWKAPLPDGPVIFALNHPSTIDPAILTTLVSRPVKILINGAIFNMPLFGRSLRACGHIPVVYGSGGKPLEEAVNLLKAGHSVAIFPEGAISPVEGGFHPPHSGLARIALCSGAPVIPVGIHLDHRQLRVVDSGKDGQIDRAAWYFNGPYAVTVGQAMVFKGMSENRGLVQQVGEQVMRQIIILSGESARQVRLRARMNWLGAAQWWLASPVRLARALLVGVAA